ncbi:MAG: hypothetical protein ABIM99_01735 [Candidatus Dojkabacteria bacterium]
MKAKNLIFLTLVFGIILIGIIITIFLLASQPVNITTTPISKPVSMPGETVISIEQGNVDNFDVAVINADDTIDLKNIKGERIPINLDKNSWKNINWSPDGKLLSVLGKTADNVFDLFIFNLSTKSWRQATKFNQATIGVSSYLWRDSNVILFTQGTPGEHWIHQYVYASGEITKLNRTEGELFTIAGDAKSMVVKLNNNNEVTSFAFYKIDGTLIYNLSKVSDTTSNLPIAIKNITYTTSSENIVLTSMEGKLYKHVFGNSNAIEISVAEGFTPICGVTEKIVVGLQKNIEGKIFLDTINIDNTPLINIASTDSNGKDIDFSKTKCYKLNNVALNIEGNWYLAKDSEFNEFFALKTTKEASFRTLTD